MGSKIVIVEDSKETCAMLEAALAEEGFVTVCAGTIKEALNELRAFKPNLLVLDINLPDGDGRDLCRRLRRDAEMGSLPVIALTGRDGFADKLGGFDAGVDQYLTKPIDMEEFVVWVKALLRRVQLDTCGGKVITLGDLKLDSRSQMVLYKGARIDGLTAREFTLLCALVKNSPRIFSRREILSRVWQTVSVENLVDTHLFNLRKKLPAEISGCIESVPGRGFRYYFRD